MIVKASGSPAGISATIRVRSSTVVVTRPAAATMTSPRLDACLRGGAGGIDFHHLDRFVGDEVELAHERSRQADRRAGDAEPAAADLAVGEQLADRPTARCSTERRSRGPGPSR